MTTATLSRAARKQAEQQEAIGRLHELLSPGDTVYTILRHVSSSGMTRDIDLYVIRDNKPHWISSLVAKSCDYRRTPSKDSLRVGGVGMDMGFAVVYDLSQVLFDDGYSLKQSWL